mmetsp:Transcript_23989/g.57875  ORF Transcript_23989/g.57875 Transcript_23989/m.57875 type:complete len:109 (-) Transcript_23989:730-1056(-)
MHALLVSAWAVLSRTIRPVFVLFAERSGSDMAACSLQWINTNNTGLCLSPSLHIPFRVCISIWLRARCTRVVAARRRLGLITILASTSEHWEACLTEASFLYDPSQCQ